MHIVCSKNLRFIDISSNRVNNLNRFVNLWDYTHEKMQIKEFFRKHTKNMGQADVRQVID